MRGTEEKTVQCRVPRVALHKETIKPKKMRCAGYVARISVGKNLGREGDIWKPRRRWEDNIRLDDTGIRVEDVGVDLISLATEHCGGFLLTQRFNFLFHKWWRIFWDADTLFNLPWVCCDARAPFHSSRQTSPQSKWQTAVLFSTTQWRCVWGRGWYQPRILKTLPMFDVLTSSFLRASSGIWRKMIFPKRRSQTILMGNPLHLKKHYDHSKRPVPLNQLKKRHKR